MRRQLARLASSATSGPSLASLPRDARERAKQQGASVAVASAQAYKAHQAAPTEATARILAAQTARRARIQHEASEDASPYADGPEPASYGLEAQFAQMEREGEFKNLSGSGKPLAERNGTHFSDDAGMDHVMKRILAENNFAPPSIALRKEFLAKRSELRSRLLAAASAAEAVSEGSRRGSAGSAALEHAVAELVALRERFDDASVKDSISYSLPIGKLPPLGTLEQELAAARAARTTKAGVRFAD